MKYSRNSPAPARALRIGPWSLSEIVQRGRLGVYKRSRIACIYVLDRAGADDPICYCCCWLSRERGFDNFPSQPIVVGRVLAGAATDMQDIHRSAIPFLGGDPAGPSAVAAP
jgi:hypothetical protein